MSDEIKLGTILVVDTLNQPSWQVDANGKPLGFEVYNNENCEASIYLPRGVLLIVVGLHSCDCVTVYEPATKGEYFIESVSNFVKNGSLRIQ